MRYARIRLYPTDRPRFHPIGETLDADPDVHRGPIYRLDLLEDGSGAMLSVVRGDMDRYCELLEDSEYIHDFAISGDGCGFSYIHFDPVELNREMMLRRRESEVMFDMPIEIDDEDGSYYVTMIGDDAAFTDAFEGLPEAVGTEVIEMGEYHADARELFDRLTGRQQEILEVAVDEGYYENPREATHEDIAAVVGVSSGTVGEHLRKIESRVFSQVVLDRSRRGAPDPA